MIDQMKKIRIGHMLLGLLALAFSSCMEDEMVTLRSSASIDVVASETDVILTSEGEGTDVLTISWPKPDYGFSAAPTYYIYLDASDGDFSEAIAINLGPSLSKTFKSEELNKHLLNLGFEEEVEGTLKYKIEAKLGTYESIFSEVKTINATPYEAFLDLSTTWGVVGSGYNNWGAFPDAPFYTTKETNVLVAYVTLLNGHIKFRENNAWDNNLGDTGADGTLENGGSDIAVTAGTYKITMNPVAKTYSIAAYSWGIVGSAYNDWGNAGPDAKFIYDDATDQWRAVVKLLDGQFKIRKNNDWGLNYGDNGANGTLESGGADINITAGKYLVTFNENDLTFTIESIPNIWGLVGSAYNDWGNGGPDAQFHMDFRNEGVWVLKNVPLLAGAFKIRDDNSWGTNYGDTDANGSLELNGTDIVSEVGIYTITLDFSVPNSPTWSKVKH
jgi:hypothetical protein